MCIILNIYYFSKYSSHKFSSVQGINNKLKKWCIKNMFLQAVHNLKYLGFAYIIQWDNKIINKKEITPTEIFIT